MRLIFRIAGLYPLRQIFRGYAVATYRLRNAVPRAATAAAIGTVQTTPARLDSQAMQAELQIAVGVAA